MRIGAAHGGEQHTVARLALGRQIAGVEKEPFAGATAHEHGWNGALAHSFNPAASCPAMRPNTAPRMTEVEPV